MDNCDAMGVLAFLIRARLLMIKLLSIGAVADSSIKTGIVTIDGRKWADWRYVPMLKRTKDYSHIPVYTRFLTTSYKGQLLEVTFTSNLNTDPKLKAEIDHIMDSVHLEE